MTTRVPFFNSFAALTVALLMAVCLADNAHAAESQWSIDTAFSLPTPEEDGVSAEIYEARVEWQTQVLKRLQETNVEPMRCDSADPCEGGNIILSFAVGSDGRIFDQTFIRSSGSAGRDTAALATLTRITPLPAPPLFDDEDEAVLEVVIRREKSD
jgi:TonB family protein